MVPNRELELDSQKEDLSTAQKKEMATALLQLKEQLVKNLERLSDAMRDQYQAGAERATKIREGIYAKDTAQLLFEEYKFYRDHPCAKEPEHPQYAEFVDNWLNAPAETSVQASTGPGHEQRVVFKEKESRAKVQLSDLPELPLVVKIDGYMGWKREVKMEFARSHVNKSDQLNQIMPKLDKNPTVNTIAEGLASQEEFLSSAHFREKCFDDFLRQTEAALFEGGIDEALETRLSEIKLRTCTSKSAFAETVDSRYRMVMYLHPEQQDEAFFNADGAQTLPGNRRFQ